MTPSSYFSQMGEDKYVDTTIFHGMTRGVFVDIGAHDGKTFSNTYFFEKYRQWTGICVEPLPEMYDKLVKNRTAKTYNVCIGSRSGTQDFLKVSGSGNAEMFSGLASSIDKRELENIKKEVKKRNGKIEVIRVKTVPLSKVLKDNDITHIDYLSIDTEGNELDVLKSIDFSVCDITCIGVEDLFGSGVLRTFLEKRGYGLRETLDKDLIFVKNSKLQLKKTGKKTALPTLSVVIHTKNEAENIKDCIESCPSYVNEYIVADMESTDQTVTIAKKLGAKIVPVRNVGLADPMRNTALAATTCDWTLVLDADERLTPALHKIIQKIISSDEVDVVLLPRKNIMLGSWIQHGLRWPDYQKRLFRKGFVEWSDGVHEQPKHTGRLYELPVVEKNAIVHYHTKNVDHLLQKTVQQAALERFYDTQDRLTPETVHHRMDMEFPWRFYEFEGYKDKTHGLIVNKFMEIYRILEYSYFWERAGHPELGSEDTLRHLWSTEEQLKSISEELKVIKDSKFFIFWKLYSRLKEKFGRFR